MSANAEGETLAKRPSDMRSFRDEHTGFLPSFGYLSLARTVNWLGAMSKHVSVPVLVILLAVWLTGCLVDGDPEFAGEVQPLAAGFSGIAATEAGFMDGLGAIARVEWSGPPCDSDCTVEVDFGSGWQKLTANTDFALLSARVIETAGLTPGALYKFRITTPSIPPQVKDLGNGYSSSTPGYPGETSPEAHLLVTQGPSNVSVAILNQGIPGQGTALPSPFFNSIDQSGRYVAETLNRAELSYAFIDSNGDGEALQTRFGYENFTQPDGTVFDYAKLGFYGPAQSVAFDTLAGSGWPPVYEWQPLHSNLMAKDGQNLANLVVMARINSWQTVDRPQFIAVHIAIDKSTGNAIAPVAMVGGDTGMSSATDQRVVLASVPGEPPVIHQWDWMPNPGGLPRVVGTVQGLIEFVNPNTGIPFLADVSFGFDIDVNTVR